MGAELNGSRYFAATCPLLSAADYRLLWGRFGGGGGAVWAERVA